MAVFRSDRKAVYMIPPRKPSDTSQPGKPASSGDTGKKDRLAKALRRNLQRRKTAGTISKKP